MEIYKNCLIDSRPFQMELKLACSHALVASGFRKRQPVSNYGTNWSNVVLPLEYGIS